MTKKTKVPLEEYANPKPKAEEEFNAEYEIDKILADIAKQRAQEIKLAHLKKILAETKAETIKSEEEVKKLEGKKNEEADDGLLVLSRYLADMPEDKRKEVLQIYTMLKASDKLGALSILPLLAGFRQESNSTKEPINPNSILLAEAIKALADKKGDSGMAEVVKALAEMAKRNDFEAIKTAIELIKSTQPQQPQTQQDSNAKIMELLLEFQRAQSELFLRKLEDLVQRVQPQQSLLEQILLDKDLFDRLRALFTGRSPISDEKLVELTKIEKELDLKKTELQMQQMEKERQYALEREKNELIKSIFSGPVGDMMSRLGNVAVERIRNAPQTLVLPTISPHQTPEIAVGSVLCPKCKKEFYANVATKYVVCPECKTILGRVEPSTIPDQKSNKLATKPKIELNAGVEHEDRADDSTMVVDEVSGELDTE